jgi:hypothetical protein
VVVRRGSGYLFFPGRSSRNDWPTNAQPQRGLALKPAETRSHRVPKARPRGSTAVERLYQRVYVERETSGSWASTRAERVYSNATTILDAQWPAQGGCRRGCTEGEAYGDALHTGRLAKLKPGRSGPVRHGVVLPREGGNRRERQLQLHGQVRCRGWMLSTSLSARVGSRSVGPSDTRT